MVSVRRRAFFTIDALIGLLIVAVLAAALGVALARQRRALTRFEDARSAIHLAERTLIELQNRRTLTRGRAEVAVRNLDDTAAPDGYAWIEITASVGGRDAVILGLVPREVAR
jgi:type II secretory pathway pseudopilin PulG